MTQMTPVVSDAGKVSWGQKLRWFLVPPLVTAVIILIAMAMSLNQYEQGTAGRVVAGVTVWGLDLSGQTEAQAEESLATMLPYANEEVIIFVDEVTGERWRRTPAELGLRFDTAATAAAAAEVGRAGDGLTQLQEQWSIWYHGKPVPPVVILDEGQLDRAIAELAQAIDQPAQNAVLYFNGEETSFTDAQMGRQLDRGELKSRLLQPLTDLRGAELPLLIHQLPPQVVDATQATNEAKQVVASPVSFYIAEPLADDDLARWELSVETLTNWLRVEMVDLGNGTYRHDVLIDQVALRNWLSPLAAQLHREPVNARYYFDDNTEQLVLVEPHINGRELDVEGTMAAFNQAVKTADRTIPFVLEPIVPVAHSGATAEELGITELVSDSTTWFYGSSDARKHNIARAASNFYGIVVGPGEEFSFNEFLGPISEADGYETGLIILGGRTIEGVGGGVCQVSTTIYQTAFWAGFPINERLEHGYQVYYYNDGEGPGMDATIFSPLVDLRFTNNTPYHLLIENYYNEVNQSLWVKFYSTSLGRQVEKYGPVYENIRPPKPDVWEENPDLAPGEVEQVDWAVEGAKVTIRRVVRNENGDLLLDDTFVSNYIPWQNVYQYGPGTDIANFDVSTLWDD
ncbi:MAG TPA: VanW family protein [Anaerolineae bacterium]|nr:VanW family protein [Anaerolineae bacterium]